MVVQREEGVVNTRQWMLRSDLLVPIYQELGSVPLGGPSYGEIWEVAYTDLDYIGWRKINQGESPFSGLQVYM